MATAAVDVLSPELASASASESVGMSFEMVESSTWRDEWTAMNTASVRLQLLGRGMCCRTKPRFRWVNSKGAILILIWNCLILDYYGNLGHILAGVLPTDSSYAAIYLSVTLFQALSLILLYPLAGWLADVYFGRYRVIKASLWLMWLGSLILCSCFSLLEFIPQDQTAWRLSLKLVPLPLALMGMMFGIAGFKANAIPFAIDQLSSSSGEQLSSFISWFVFTLFINIGIIPFPFACSLLDTPSHTNLVRLIYQTALLSIAVVLDCLCRHWLLVEPQSSNPFKLVRSVLSYAMKNKVPRMRSAFTYQDHIRPGRIEFAKTIFGGPFNTEQVEDVKTFLRIAVVLIPTGATLVLNIYAVQAEALFSNHINPVSLPCYAFQAVTTYSTFAVVFLVIVYELLLYPLLHNYVPSTLGKVGFGILLFILGYAALLTIDVLGQEGDTYNNSTGSTVCIFDEQFTNFSLRVSPLWMLLPSAIIGLGTFIHSTGVYEFVFSQSPYHMKGLLMGAVYAVEGVFQFLGLTIQFPFYMGYVGVAYSSYISCGSVYIALLLVLAVLWMFVYVAIALRYRRREREETKRPLDYTEAYFSKYLQKRRR